MISAGNLLKKIAHEYNICVLVSSKLAVSGILAILR